MSLQYVLTRNQYIIIACVYVIMSNSDTGRATLEF